MPMPVGGRLGRSSRFILEYDYRDGLDRNGLPVFRSGQIPTFGRGGTVNAASAMDRMGCLYTAGPVQPRFNHRYNATTGLVEPEGIILGGAQANLCANSQTLTSWGLAGAGTTVDGAVTRGSLSLSLLTDTDAVATYYRQSAPFQFATGGVAKGIAVFVRKGTAPDVNGSLLRLRDDAAGADRLYCLLYWNGGVPAPNMIGGSLLAIEYWGDGVYRLHFQSNALIAAATNHTFRVHPASNAAGVGDLFVGGIHVADATFAGPYIKTDGGAITRNADTLSIPLGASAGQLQASGISLYDEIVVLRYGELSAATVIGNTSLGGTNLISCYLVPTGVTGRLYDSASAADSLAPVTLSLFDRLERLVTVTPLGVVTTSVSVNRGTITSGPPSAAHAWPSAFNAQRVYLNDENTAARKGDMSRRFVRAAPGIRSMDYMRAGD